MCRNCLTLQPPLFRSSSHDFLFSTRCRLGRGREEAPEECRKCIALVGSERLEKPTLILIMTNEREVDQLPALRRQRNEQGATVARVVDPPNKTGGLEAVDAIGHGPG